MQELIEYLDPIHSGIKDKAIKLLEKEKEQILNAFDMGCQDEDRIGEEYYNDTYSKY